MSNRGKSQIGKTSDKTFKEINLHNTRRQQTPPKWNHSTDLQHKSIEGFPVKWAINLKRVKCLFRKMFF